MPSEKQTEHTKFEESAVVFLFTVFFLGVIISVVYLIAKGIGISDLMS